MSRRPIGWRNNPTDPRGVRHGLAARGIKSALPKSEAMMRNTPIRLPEIEYKGKEYFVDIRLEEIRDIKTARAIKFKDLDEETKAEIRGIRARTEGMYYIESLDKKPKQKPLREFERFVFEADEELIRQTAPNIKYFVSYANDTKMDVFTSKKDALKFARGVYS